MKLLKLSFIYFLILLQGLTLALSSYASDSNSELEKLEREFLQLINQANNIERHPLATQYINHMGKKLAQAANITKYHFFIVKSPEINAFAGPGNYIGINSQLILAVENEHELAGVLAHEMAHVKLRHLYGMLEHQKLMKLPFLASLLASLALGLINPALASGALAASLTGFGQENINFIRAKEKEADRIGMQILTKCGFDPRAIVSFFRKMQQNSRYYYTDNIPAILRTHPLDEERIAEIENRLATTTISYPQDYNFALFQELIRVSTATNNYKQLKEYYQYRCTNPTMPCQFGYALFLINLNQFREAEQKLKILLAQDPHNLFYQLALSEALLGNHKSTEALTLLTNLYKNQPDNYAVLMFYSDGLIKSGQNKEALRILIPGFRQFPTDISLCYTLAQTESLANHKNYAYFIQAQCSLIAGKKKEAMKQLLHAKKLTAKKDLYLRARIAAKYDELL